MLTKYLGSCIERSVISEDLVVGDFCGWVGALLGTRISNVPDSRIKNFLFLTLYKRNFRPY